MKINVEEKINLIEYHNKNINIGKELDSKCDLKIYDFIDEHFYNKRLFYTFNHPTSELLAFQYSQLYRYITGEECSAEKIRNAKSFDPLNIMQLPIHPAVIDTYRLQWISSGNKYQYGKNEYLTFEEYMWNYIHFF